MIATTSPQGHRRTALESAPDARSLLRRTAAVHFGVPFHHFMVGDPLDLFFDRELVLALPGLDDAAARRIALELGDRELPLPAAGLERGNHLGAVEDDVAIAHMELGHDR